MASEKKNHKFFKFIWGFIPYIILISVVVFIIFMIALIDEKKTNIAEAKKAALITEIPAVKVITLELQPKMMKDEISLPGEATPFEDLWIKAEVSGQIQRILVDEGSNVKEGDVIVELDTRDYESRLAQVEANYNRARLEYDRMAELVKKEIAAKTKYDEAEAQLKDLSARRDEAKLALTRTRVVAPISGRINKIKTKKGELLKIGDQVAQILQYDNVKITVGVPESDVAAVFDLQEAEIVIEALDDRRVIGKKIFLARQPRSLARLYDLELAVSNPDGRILPGMFAQVALVKSVHDDALSVPLYAVISEGNDSHVYIEHNEKAVKRTVTLGTFSGWQVQVTSGLNPGDRVIVVGHRFLENNQPVKVLKSVTDPEEIMSS